MLAGEGLIKSYGKRTVVDIERVEAAAGRTLGIVGPSGAGKSTLLALLGLLERPDAGRIVFQGRQVGVGDRQQRMRFAAAFQNPYLFKGTVADNVAYGLKLRRISKPQRAKRVSAALERVGLEGWESTSALTLSGGEAREGVGGLHLLGFLTRQGRSSEPFLSPLQSASSAQKATERSLSMSNGLVM